MQELIDQLITTGVGLGLLGGTYLVWLLTGVANNLFSTKKWSWKRTLEDIAKTCLMCVAIMAWVAVCYGVDWFAAKMGADISALLQGASVAGVIGGIIGGTVYYLGKAYNNIIAFVNANHVEVEVKNPDYKTVADTAKAIADAITPAWTVDEKQTSAEAAAEAISQVGKGEFVNPLDRRLPDGDDDNGNGWQAHRLGTLINLYDGGYKKVEELIPGDRLIADNGEVTKVVNAWHDNHPIYEIKTTQGIFYYTPEHPLLVADKGYTKTKDLCIGDRLVPDYSEAEAPETNLSDGDLCLLGYWLGDGYVDFSDKYTTKFCVVANKTKKEYLDSVTNRISWSKHSNGKDWLGYIRKGDGTDDNSNSKKESLLHEYLIKCGRYSFGKTVAFRASLREREKILAGYLEADGYDRGSGFVVTTTSEQLARWAQKTAWDLGKNSYVSKIREAGYQTNFGECKHGLWSVSISKNNFDRHTDGGFEILGITLIGNEPTVHIEVDGNHTYVAENIKVHNCSKYSYYLGTGIIMHYAPHPDYGPCNGRDMVNYLIDNYGFVPCGKINGAIFSYDAGDYGHTGMVLDAASNTVNDANWSPLKVDTHYLNLDAMGATYCCPPEMLKPDPTPTPTPTPAPTPASGFKVWDKVVPTRLVDYYGTPLIQYDDYYTISELDGDRAVLTADRNGEPVIWAAMNTKDLRKV